VPPTDKYCVIDPRNRMDWHIHCPQGTCPAGTGQLTPTDGAMSLSGQNSLHFGYHFDPPAATAGDTTRFRQLAAFMTNPINLTPSRAPAISSCRSTRLPTFIDNNTYNCKTGQANDFGDVHIQVFDAQANGGRGGVGFWDRLAPFQNVSTITSPYIWSTFGAAPTYCIMTPTDTGTAATRRAASRKRSASRTASGRTAATSRDTTTTFQCHDADDQGHVGATGVNGSGLWMQSKFNLGNFSARRSDRLVAHSGVDTAGSVVYFERPGTVSTPESWTIGWSDSSAEEVAQVELALHPETRSVDTGGADVTLIVRVMALEGRGRVARVAAVRPDAVREAERFLDAARRVAAGAGVGRGHDAVGRSGAERRPDVGDVIVDVLERRRAGPRSPTPPRRRSPGRRRPGYGRRRNRSPVPSCSCRCCCR